MRTFVGLVVMLIAVRARGDDGLKAGWTSENLANATSSCTDTPQLAFENQHKPAETKAIAGNVKALAPSVVASAMIDGMARGDFEIFADLASRLAARTNGLLPGLARRLCDAAQRRAVRA